MDRTALELPEPKVRHEQGDTDWKRAFLVLVAFLSNGFYGSNQLSRIAQSLYDEVGEEAGDLMLTIVNKHRSNWMQDFMG